MCVGGWPGTVPPGGSPHVSVGGWCHAYVELAGLLCLMRCPRGELVLGHLCVFTVVDTNIGLRPLFPFFCCTCTLTAHAESIPVLC